MTQDLANNHKTIMIVDDEPNNLNVLEAMLREDGNYDVMAFPNGAMALDAVFTDPPDLILLDVRMPGMDGFEVCRRLKADKNLGKVPILFLSALTDPLDKVKAFELGAVDYLTKPLNEAEVLARVRTHMKLRDYQLDMEEQVRIRSEELLEAHRRLQVWDDAKTQWLGVLSHEMRTPLTGLFGVGDYVFDELPDDSPLKDFKDDYNHSRERVLKLVDDAFLLSNINVDSEAFKFSPVRLSSVVESALNQVDSGYASVVILPPESTLISTRILADSTLLCRALGDLLKVASVSIPAGGKVFFDVVSHPTELKLLISTNGPSLPASSLECFFEVGGQRHTIAPGGDYGLRPALAAHIVDLFKGSISIRNGEQTGIVIEMCFPQKDSSDSALR